MKLIPELKSQELGSDVIQMRGQEIKKDGDFGFCADALALRRAQLYDACNYLRVILARLDLEEEDLMRKDPFKPQQNYPNRAMRNEVRSFLESVVERNCTL